MVGKSKPASAAEQKRMGLIKREAWCIPCILNNTSDRPATTIQHVVEGRVRLGHDQSYGSCGWHHQAMLEAGLSRFDMQYHFGASLAHGSKEFAITWAPERDLVKLQDYLIDLYVENGPWEQYHMPINIRRLVKIRWQELLGLR